MLWKHTANTAFSSLASVLVSDSELLHWGNTQRKHQYKQISALGKCNASSSAQTAHYTQHWISEERNGIQTRKGEQDGGGMLQVWSAPSGNCPRCSLSLWAQRTRSMASLRVSPPVNGSKQTGWDSQTLGQCSAIGFGVRGDEASPSQLIIVGHIWHPQLPGAGRPPQAHHWIRRSF